MIKLEQLQHFLLISEHKSLIEAAERLHRTPSALSMTLKNLEHELGGPLFEGDRKRQLTPLGHCVRQSAQTAVDEFRKCLADIDRFARGDTGLIRIAAVPSAATRELPSAIARHLHTRASLRIEMRDTDSEAVQHAVTQGKADIGIASFLGEEGKLAGRLLRTEPFVCVCAEEHPLATETRPLHWRDIKRQVFIHNNLCTHIENATLHQLSATSQLQVHNIASLLAFVRRGLGITLLPLTAISDTSGLAIKALADKRAQRSLFLLRRANQTPSPAVQCLSEDIVKAFQV